jgi:endonuclease YncB( thermonuclease family)
MRLLTAMVAAFVCSPAIAADYLGKVLAVSDGDTFTMEADGAKVRVRICGIDAPRTRASGLRTGRRRVVEHDRGQDSPLPAGG